MKKVYHVAVLGLLTLWGCDGSDDETIVYEGTKVEIFATLSGFQTRASSGGWNLDDPIGVTVGSSGAENRTNIKYTCSNAGTGAFAVADGATDIYVTTSSTLLLTAYYPYTGSNGVSAGTIDVTVGTEQQTEEAQPDVSYLFGYSTVTLEDASVSIEMESLMSEVCFEVEGVDDDEISSLTFTLGQLSTQGTFDTSEGVVSASSSATDEVSTPTQSDSSSASVILIPQSAEDVPLTVEFNGTDYAATLSSLELEASYVTTFLITIDTSSETPTITLESVTVSDWTGGDSITIPAGDSMTQVDVSADSDPGTWAAGDSKNSDATTGN